MGELVVIALAGFCASMVDGALGMGFGPTSSTILLSTGLSPAAVSTTVNLAKVATGISAAISHWRFENIDHKLVVRMAVPGCVGAGVGVTILANVDGDDIKPILSAVLIVIGLRILVRFSRRLATAQEHDPATDGPPSFEVPGITAAAGFGGVTNGLVGAWGPVVTPFLLHRRIPPRYAIGSVNTAEVAVAVVASGSLLASLGGDGIKVSTVVAMLLGGVIASPISAWLIRFLPARALGLAVAALLLLTNARELAGWADLGAERWAIYAAVIAGVWLAAVRPRWRERAVAPGRPPAVTPR